MNLGRASKFGLVGAIGVIIISIGAYGLMAMAWSDRIRGSEGMVIASIVIIGIAGMGIGVVFLFLVIGAFLDRELEARGITEP